MDQRFAQSVGVSTRTPVGYNWLLRLKFVCSLHEPEYRFEFWWNRGQAQILQRLGGHQGEDEDVIVENQVLDCAIRSGLGLRNQ